MRYNPTQRASIAEQAKGKVITSFAWEEEGQYWVITFDDESEISVRLMAEIHNELDIDGLISQSYPEEEGEEYDDSSPAPPSADYWVGLKTADSRIEAARQEVEHWKEEAQKERRKNSELGFDYAMIIQQMQDDFDAQKRHAQYLNDILTAIANIVQEGRPADFNALPWEIEQKYKGKP